jgi:hypothetical protein
MPRIRVHPEPISNQHPELVRELQLELQNNREFGQPLILEEPFARSEELRITVVWDKFDGIDDDERARIILAAYQRSDAPPTKIAVALGLTFPEAADDGLLPYDVVPNWRASDPVSLERCFGAMKKLGASTLRNPIEPELRCATAEQAGACVSQLVQVLPESKGIWKIFGHMRAMG